jgi:hypothetical protein
MPDLLTGTDAQMWISNASVADTVDTSAEFAALTWVAIGLIESIGEYGDESAEITGNVINEGRTRRAKGRASTMMTTWGKWRFVRRSSRATATASKSARATVCRAAAQTRLLITVDS